MKKILFLVFIILIFTRCEDVVEIDVPEEEPRLIVDALIRVDESLPIVNAVIKVSLTSPFFGTIPPANLRQISITNLALPTTPNPNFIILEENEPGTGIYEVLTTIDFFQDGELLLQIDYEDQIFLASTRYVKTVPIDNLEQGNGTLFEDDETEIIITYTDDGSREDFYIFDFDFDEFLVTEDTFFQGQQFQFSYFYDQDLQPGQEVEISILGADLSFYNYMNQLIEQSGDDFNPFATPVATVRGNISNFTDLDNIEFFDNVDLPNNFALGYFAVVQEFKQTITIEER
ncbi:hypothetical protein [Spongiimicrobium sp. 3-5]|uniref:hypothetical protein n=1 Tax=Spongiimicrobium sp. 3-5 TaxID=3332596 RepID=UPI0039816CF7